MPIQFTVEESVEPTRIDSYLHSCFPQQSRTFFQDLIEQGLVFVDEKPIRKRHLVEKGQTISILRDPTQNKEGPLEAEKMPLDIIYEDDWLCIINKPAGLIVHPGAGNKSHTLLNGLLAHCPQLAKEPFVDMRPGIVHRLDKETSGVIVCAKDTNSQRALCAQFASRRVQKRYMAITLGRPKLLEGTLRALIARCPKDRTKMALVQERGRLASLHYRLLKANKHLSFLEIKPLTGRTHQIRLQLAEQLHCPIVGDTVYGPRHSKISNKVARHLLHAASVSFLHPVLGTDIQFEAPLPDDFEKKLISLKENVGFLYN